MSKTLDAIKATRPWVRYIDDERRCGNGIIVTLADGHDFADDPGCGVKGFDTVSEVRAGTTKASVVEKQAAVAKVEFTITAWTKAGSRGVRGWDVEWLDDRTGGRREQVSRCTEASFVARQIERGYSVKVVIPAHLK